MDSRKSENGSIGPLTCAYGPERRLQIRVRPSVLSAILHMEGEPHVVTICDISQAGAKIRNAPPGLGVGDTIRLATSLRDGEVTTVVCTIAYANGNEAQCEVGVRFENAGDADAGALIKYLGEVLEGQLAIADHILATWTPV